MPLVAPRMRMVFIWAAMMVVFVDCNVNWYDVLS